MLERDNKNEMIGIFLMMAILFGYNFLVQNETPPPAQKAKIENKVVSKNSISPMNAFKGIQSDSNLKATQFLVETDDLKVTFSTKGAAIQRVELKNYKTYNKKPLVLLDEKSNSFSTTIPTSQGKIETNSLVFSTNNQVSKITGKDSLVVKFQSILKSGETIENSYVLKGKGYEVPFNLNILNKVSNKTENATIVWSNSLKQLENDLEMNRKETKITYFDENEDEFNDFLAASNETKDIVEPLKWFSFKQLYFNTGLVNLSSNFSTTKFTSEVNELDSTYVKKFTASVTVPLDNLAANKGKFKFYFGPNEVSILKPVSDVYRNIVYLGYDIVKPVNRYLFVPMFNFYEKYINNYGLLIILVVLTIKLFLTPLVYKSYISNAKTRILAPEIEELKKKIGDDPAKLQQEQMKLYQQVGVSPMAGCVPVLLQMPILMSVFFLFPNMIMFRQKPFLWANDLSTYDAPIQWAQNLPVIGNHISLFAVFYLISTLAYTYYNNQITPNQPGPVDMKKLSYIFPVVFFFVLNSFSAALNFYYFVSNLVTILQQLIIKRFVDEDKIKAILEENRTKFKANPSAVKKSKFSSFLEKSMKAAEEAKKQQELAEKSKKSKK